MTPDTDTPMTLDEALAELEAIRAIVDGAITACQLGEAIAAHFGRPLPDWNTH